MDFFETRGYRRGYQRIAGVDEAGRGPLAGPVVASAVILPREGIGTALFDSKQIPPEKREELYELIFERALAVGVGSVGQDEIDRINILEATRKAMARAVEALSLPPDYILVDGLHGFDLPILQKPIPKGDQLSRSIAAASIVAKVTRDRFMLECHLKYPEYNFGRHKGYGTEEHRRAIERYGPCELHRKTFRGVREFVKP
jgi:ribonuclease HII